MSIASAITRLQGLKAQLRAKLLAWGLIIDQDADLEDCCDAIDTVPAKTSANLTVSGATVTAPAGFYNGDATKTIASASTPYGGLAGINSSGDVTFEVEIDTGGYIGDGTYSVTDSGAVTVQAAQTIHPSTSDQIIAANKYLTGAQTVKGVLLTNLSAGNIKDGVIVKVGDSSDDDCVASITGTYSGGGSGGTGLVYETGSVTISGTSNYQISVTFTDTHTEAPFFIGFSDTDNTAESTTNTCYAVCFFDFYKLFGVGIPYNSSAGRRYGLYAQAYRSTDTTKITAGSGLIQYNSDNTGASSQSYARYWAREDKFTVYSGGTSRYFKKDRTYKWIAVWKPTA